MITVKAFVNCSCCNKTFSNEMDNAATGVFQEAINSLMTGINLLDSIETIDEDKGVCICTDCFKKWLAHIESDWEYDDGDIDEWQTLINEMKDSTWCPPKPEL